MMNSYPSDEYAADYDNFDVGSGTGIDQTAAARGMNDSIIPLPSILSSLTIDITTLPVPSRAPELLLLHSTDGGESSRVYWDRSHYDSPESQLRALATSSTLYVGNMNFSTRVSHIRSHFSMIGYVKDVVMGVDRYKKTPCGFCFVEFQYRKHALAAVSLLSGTKLDGKIIRVELDAGFQNGRQYGRGHHGGQVRDFRKQKSTQQQQQLQHYRSGDKRSRNGGENTDVKRPSIEDALPTGRIRANSTTGKVDNGEDSAATFGNSDETGLDAPSTVLDDNATDQVINNNENSGNVGGDDDDDEIMTDDAPPSKRQRT